MPTLIGAIDQGTSGTRFIAFAAGGSAIAAHQLPHRQITPRPGWVEHDPVEIWQNTLAVIDKVVQSSGVTGSGFAALGITNQRETTIVWDRRTGQPIHHAIVWQDTRTAEMMSDIERSVGAQAITECTGLRPSPYFSASKIRWMLDHVPGARVAAEAGHLAFGTVDSWLLWNLTGDVHATDVTNASRTMLMNIHTLTWDDDLLELFGIPRSMMPTIRPSSDATALGATTAGGAFDTAVPITSILGDQQAATVGQGCFAPGDAKCTYGTGSFVLVNAGTDATPSSHGLLTTVGYQFGTEPATYAIEGSIASSGATIQWLTDQLGIIDRAADIEPLAASVSDTEGVYLVPALAGLLAPYWLPDARAAIVGLTRFHSKAHVARAALESICYRTRDVLDAVHADTGLGFAELRVDGGVTANDLCMQLQADILGIPVARGVTGEITAAGAAIAAAHAIGVSRDLNVLRAQWRPARRWTPRWSDARREGKYQGWQTAVRQVLPTDGKGDHA